MLLNRIKRVVISISYVKKLAIFLESILCMYRYDRENRKGWTNRRSTEYDDHLKLYWDSEHAPNREDIAGVISSIINHYPSNKKVSVLEFGSHVGINLKMIKDRCEGRNVDFFAVEPNAEAYNFMKSKLSFVRGLNGNDVDFLKRKDFPNQHIDISLVNAVLYSMSYRSAIRVLRKLSQISDVLIIGDETINLKGDKTIFFQGSDYKGNSYNSLGHPFKKILLQLGYKSNNIKLYSITEPQKALAGLIVAKKIQR